MNGGLENNLIGGRKVMYLFMLLLWKNELDILIKSLHFCREHSFKWTQSNLETFI